MSLNKSGRESITTRKVPSRRVVRWLGGTAIPVVVAALLATGCASGSPNVASPRNFFLTGVTWWHNGSESLSLVGCLPTSDEGKGGTEIGSNLSVGGLGTVNVGETILGTSYVRDPEDPESAELLGTTLVDTSTGIDDSGGTIVAQKLDNFINTHGTVAEALTSSPQFYAGAKCVRYSVSPSSVRTFLPGGGYSASAPFPSEAADDQILGSEPIVNWAPATGQLTILASYNG
jgi:hypothetical protein